MPGQIVHFEIPADDTGESREFWGGLFGWQFESYPGPFEYHMTRISDQGGLAITNMEPGKRGGRSRCAVHARAGVRQGPGCAAGLCSRLQMAQCGDRPGNAA